MQKKSFFTIEKFRKYLKCPALRRRTSTITPTHSSTTWATRPGRRWGTLRRAGQRLGESFCTCRFVGRAGHLKYFLIFSPIKNDFLCIFYKANNPFLHQSYSHSPNPSQINLIKKCKKSFFYWNI